MSRPAERQDASLRPGSVCGQLLLALDASDGRRRRRQRDTTPDSIGLAIKRSLLQAAVDEDPDPDGFESWLLARCERDRASGGAMHAMAREVLGDWRLALTSPAFREWLAGGAASDDRP